MTARVHPFPTVAPRVLMRHTAPMVEVLTCDDCGESAFDICAIPAPFGTDHICANCFPRDKHAAEYDFTDFPLVQTGARLAEPQLQRVRDHIDATEPDLFDMTPVYRGLFLAVAFAAGWAIAALTLAFMLGAW